MTSMAMAISMFASIGLALDFLPISWRRAVLLKNGKHGTGASEKPYILGESSHLVSS